MYYVYILFSEGFNKYYIGQTNNIDIRLAQHNLGYNVSTKPYRPWKMVLCIPKETRAEAMDLERKLKNLSRLRIEAFILKYKK